MQQRWKPCAHVTLGCPWKTVHTSGYCEPCRNRGCTLNTLCAVRQAVEQPTKGVK